MRRWRPLHIAAGRTVEAALQEREEGKDLSSAGLLFGVVS